MGDPEKILNSRWYNFFNWVVRLVFANIMALLTPMVIGFGLMCPWLFINSSNIFFIIIAIIGALSIIWLAIPSVCACYSLIKAWNEGSENNTFKPFYILYWRYLKELWLYELIMIPIVLVLGFGIYAYYKLLSNEGLWFWIGAIGFGVTAILAWFVILAGVHLPACVSTFRMKTIDLIKLTFINAFRMFPSSLLWFIIYYGVAALILVNSFFTPVYFIIGLALSTYAVEMLSHSKYAYLEAKLVNPQKTDK